MSKFQHHVKVQPDRGANVCNMWTGLIHAVLPVTDVELEENAAAAETSLLTPH